MKQRIRIVCQNESKWHFSSLDANGDSVRGLSSHFPLFFFIYLLLIPVHHLLARSLQEG